jgi:hypothetical protein
MTSGHCGIRAQLSSMLLSVRFRTDSAMTPTCFQLVSATQDADAAARATDSGIPEKSREKVGKQMADYYA